MKIRTRYLFTVLFALLILVPPAFAEAPTTSPPGPAFTQAELDQMLAPIALYPDSLLSQMMMAATYPLEVVEAARWSRANPGLQGEAAVRAVDDRNWDPSVKSLVAFPQILTMMDEKLEWTERLGDAFLAQQPQVMDTVQGLRQRAYAAGNLKSNDQYRVVQQERIIVVESPNPQVVYVPYYDPLVVYGGWWWPAYRPVFWAPWPGYVVRPGYVGGFRWSIGITIGPRFFFGACDWHRRSIQVVNVHPFYYHYVDRRPIVVGHWQHYPDHRRGVVYKHVEVQRKFVHANASPAPRREYQGGSHRGGNPDNGHRDQARLPQENRRDAHPRSDSYPGRVTQRSDERRTETPAKGDVSARLNTPMVHKGPNHQSTPDAKVVREAPDKTSAPRRVIAPTAESHPVAAEGVSRGQEGRHIKVREYSGVAENTRGQGDGMSYGRGVGHSNGGEKSHR